MSLYILYKKGIAMRHVPLSSVESALPDHEKVPTMVVNGTNMTRNAVYSHINDYPDRSKQPTGFPQMESLPAGDDAQLDDSELEELLIHYECDYDA
jgi:hypothetical protein